MQHVFHTKASRAALQRVTREPCELLQANTRFDESIRDHRSSRDEIPLSRSGLDEWERSREDLKMLSRSPASTATIEHLKRFPIGKRERAKQHGKPHVALHQRENGDSDRDNQ